MTNERKKLYVSVFVNFLIGIMVGIILFYGQMQNSADIGQSEYTYNAAVELTDFFRVSWLNMLWLFSVFIAHNILPLAYIHPIIIIRGCSNSFSVMYMFHFIGVKEAVVSVLPQCFSILPLLMVMSARLVEKRRRLNFDMGEPLALRRSETMMFFIFSILAGAAELFFFRIFYFCLF